MKAHARLKALAEAALATVVPILLVHFAFALAPTTNPAEVSAALNSLEKVSAAHAGSHP